MCKLEDWLSVQEPGTQCSPACDSPEDILTSLRRIGASDQQREVADLISTESKWIETLFSFAHYIFKGTVLEWVWCKFTAKTTYYYRTHWRCQDQK